MARACSAPHLNHWGRGAITSIMSVPASAFLKHASPSTKQQRYFPGFCRGGGAGLEGEGGREGGCVLGLDRKGGWEKDGGCVRGNEGGEKGKSGRGWGTRFGCEGERE